MQSLLPKNATELELALEQATARIEDVPIPIRTMWRPSQIPEPLLPWLAWALSVDDWEHGWETSVRRNMAEGSFLKHRRKGTPAALKAALADIGVETELQEWFEYGGQPYTFRVAATFENTPWTPIQSDSLYSIVLSAKNLRSMLDQITVKSRLRAELGSYWGRMQCGGRVVIAPPIQSINCVLPARMSGGQKTSTVTCLAPVPKRIDLKITLRSYGATIVGAERTRLFPKP